MQDRNAELVKLVAGADAREHQDVRRLEGAGAQDDLAAFHGEYLATALRLNPNRSW